MSYQLDSKFERRVSVLCASHKVFWLRIGSRVAADQLNDKVNQTLVKLAKAVAAEHGWSTEDLVCQRAALWMSEGKIDEPTVLAIGDAFSQADPEVDIDQTVTELVEPVRRNWMQELASKVIDRYKNGGKFGNLVDDMVACDRIGEPVADVETKASEFGEDTDTLLDGSAISVQIPTGICELDSEFNGGLPLGTLTTVLMDSKAGKCHRRGQGILMYDGSIRKVEDIVVGDQIMGPDGAPRNVLSLSRGRGQMYDIIPKRGQPWGVNADHILTVQHVTKPGGRRWKWRTVDVPVSEWLKWPATWKKNSYLFRADSVEFNVAHQELPIDPYFLGVYLGDGTSANSSVGISTADPEIVSTIYSAAAAWKLKVSVSKRDGNAAADYRFTGTSGKKSNVAKLLEKLELRHLQSGDKFIPSMYKTAPAAARLELLAGLMDTDGSLTKKSAYDYISKSPRLANDVAFVARSLGLAAYVVQCTKKCQTGAVGTYYRVSISGDAWRIPVRIPRKKAAPRKRKGYDTRRSSFKIVEAGIEDFYGFALDGDSRFLLDDFTVTHNSVSMCHFAAVAALHGENVAYMSLELPREEIHRRILAAIVGVPINELLNPTVRADAIRIWRRLKDQGKIGRIVIDQFPQQSVDEKGVVAWFERQEKEHDTRFRYRIVDYGDLIASSKREDRESEYGRGKTVWTALYNMASRQDSPNWVVTATQSKRPESKPGQILPVLTRKDVADSVHKYRLSDFFITGTPQPDMRAEQGYIWYIDADRYFGKTGTQVGPVPHQRWMSRMADISHLGG